MKKIALLICLLVSGQITSAQDAIGNASDRLERALAVSLLINDDPLLSRTGTQMIVRKFGKTTELTDLIASLLLRKPELQTNGRYIDTLSWYARALGDVGNPRYRETLQKAREIYVEKKILKFVDESLVKLGDGAAEQYAYTELDIAKLTDDAAVVMAAHKRADRQAFASLAAGTSLSDTLARLGSPEDVTVPVFAAYGRGRISQVHVHYANTGLVMFRYDSKSSDLVSFGAESEVIPVSKYYSGKYFGIVQALCSLRGQTLREYHARYARRVQRDPAALTAYGQRILAIPIPADRYEDDVHAKGVAMVGRLRDITMLDLLKQIAATTQGRDTKNVADEYVEALQIWQSQGKLRNPKPAAAQEEPQVDEQADDQEDAP